MSEGFYRRAVAFSLRDAAPDGDGLTLEGYAAVFNSPTLIRDWDGEYEETIAPGAFRHTIRNGRPVLQFDHGQHPVLGSIPIGSIEDLAEDTRGLYIRARVFDNWMTEPLRQAIEAQAVDGMSFRFSVVKESWVEPKEIGALRQRTLKEVRLFELGPVVFPAYQDTAVALRGLVDVVPNLTLMLSGTSEEPAAEARGSSDEAAITPDPASGQSVTDPVPPNQSVSPSTQAERQAVARRIRFDRRNDT